MAFALCFRQFIMFCDIQQVFLYVYGDFCFLVDKFC